MKSEWQSVQSVREWGLWTGQKIAKIYCEYVFAFPPKLTPDLGRGSFYIWMSFLMRTPCHVADISLLFDPTA